MSQPDLSRYYAALGVPSIDSYDRQAILDSIRENRRRNARDDASRALDEAAAMIRTELTRELGPAPDAVDVLLQTASMLGAFVIHGLNAEDTLAIIARLADDLTQPAS